MANTKETAPDSLFVVFVTVPSRESADALARRLVEDLVAACVNILPGVRSVYRWEGKIEESEELLLVIKTRGSLVERLEEVIRSNHPYQVPEIVALKSAAVNKCYLEWVFSETPPR